MATLTKKNEAVIAPAYKNGVSLQFLEIDFGADVSAKLTATTSGARSPVAVALEAISQVASVEIIGTVQADSGSNAGQLLRVAVAALGGNFPTTGYGSTGTTFVQHCQNLVRDGGTHQSVNLASASVTSYTF